MIDLVHPNTGKTVIYGKTLEDCRQEHGYELAELMLVDDFCKQKAAKQDSPLTFDQTTEDEFNEMLNVLPPAYMGHGFFLVGEPCDHHALTGEPRYQAYGEAMDKFIKSSRPMTIRELKQYIA